MISKYLINYRNVTIITVFSASFGFLRNVLLGRSLSISDFSKYSLALTVIAILSAILLFGQHKGYIRFFIKNSLEDYNWKKPMFALIIISIVISSFILPIISKYYSTNPSFIFFCFCTIICSIVIEMSANVLKSINEFNFAIFLQRTNKVIVAFLVLFVFLFDQLVLTKMFFLFGLVNALYSIFVLFIICKKIKAGSKKMPTSSFKAGFYFLLQDLIILIQTYGINLIIVEKLGLDSLGVFFALNILLRIFEVFNQSTDFITMPSSGSFNGKEVFIIFKKNIFIGAIISIFFIFFGDFSLSFIYDSKYDDYLNLINWVCLLGLIKLLEIIPTSIISGVFNENALKKYVFYNFGITLIIVPLSIILMNTFNLLGAIISLIIIHSFKMFYGTFLLIKKYMSKTKVINF